VVGGGFHVPPLLPPLLLQLAVTVTLPSGMVNVVVALFALARVTPPLFTVQPLKAQLPLRVPARIVTVVPAV
jgi:hypothetical protein